MITSIVGLMNSGKTLYMTFRLYLDYLRGRDIITNYDLNFPHFKINQDWLLNLVINNPDTILTNCSFGFDELWLWLLDSRSSMGNEAKIGTYFFLQSSKSDSNIYVSAQDNSQNDIRLRNNLHRIVQCQRTFFIDNKFKPVKSDKRFLNKVYGKWINDLLFIEATEYKRVLDKFGLLDTKKISTQYIPAKLMFDLFDTTKRINPNMEVLVKND